MITLLWTFYTYYVHKLMKERSHGSSSDFIYNVHTASNMGRRKIKSTLAFPHAY